VPSGRRLSNRETREERNIRPLSYTQISLYRQCPLSYKLQYIDGLKPPEKWYFSFGNTLHSCAEYFFRIVAPPPPSLEELLQFYDENWVSDGYVSLEEEARYREYGKEILTRFWETNHTDFRMPIALERSFNLDVDGIKVRGFIDRVDKLASGGLSIIDYKSGRDLFTTDYLADDLQLTIYQMAAEQTWGLPVERLTLYHLRSNTPCVCSPRDREAIGEARRLILDVAGNIARGSFPATENQFCPCDFPEHCPYYRHQYIKPALPAPEIRQELLPGIAAMDALETYVSLQAQIKELERQMQEARQQIIGYCQAEGLNRLYGASCEINFKMMQKTGFDGDEVRGVLEPAGLWERVLGLDQSLLKELLADDSVPVEVRRAVAALRRVVSSYPQLWVKRRSAEDEAEEEE
jgi:putative RecB family exonuclease